MRWRGVRACAHLCIVLIGAAHVASTAELLAAPPRAPACSVVPLPLDLLEESGAVGAVGAATWAAAVKRAEGEHAAALAALAAASSAGDAAALDAAVAAHLQSCAAAGAAPVSAHYMASAVVACLDVCGASAGPLPRGLWRGLRRLMRTRRLAATACPALLPFICGRREVRARCGWSVCEPQPLLSCPGGAGRGVHDVRTGRPRGRTRARCECDAPPCVSRACVRIARRSPFFSSFLRYLRWSWQRLRSRIFEFLPHMRATARLAMLLWRLRVAKSEGDRATAASRMPGMVAAAARVPLWRGPLGQLL